MLASYPIFHGFSSSLHSKASAKYKCFLSPSSSSPPPPSSCYFQFRSKDPQNFLLPFLNSKSQPVGDRHILVETGRMGRQASGAVTLTDGETIIYTTVSLDDVPSEPSDFFPVCKLSRTLFSCMADKWGIFQMRREDERS